MIRNENVGYCPIWEQETYLLQGCHQQERKRGTRSFSGGGGGGGSPKAPKGNGNGNGESGNGETFNFGRETEGDSYENLENCITGAHFLCPKNATAQSVTFLSTVTTTAKEHKIGLYRKSDLALLDVTEEITIPPQILVWTTLNFPEPKPSLAVNTEYAFMAWSKLLAGGAYIRYEIELSDPKRYGYYDSDVYNDFPDPLAPTTTKNKYSIYCTCMEGN